MDIVAVLVYLQIQNMSQAKISIELLQDIAHMGRKGDIIEVASAQARNFLIPKKFAKEITPERLNSTRKRNEQKIRREKNLRRPMKSKNS